MDSLKKFNKGYGKLEEHNHHRHHHLEDQHHHQTQPKYSKPLIAAVSIFAILFLTLTLAFALIHPHHTNTPNSPNSLNSVTDSIRFVCNVTRFPNSCFTSITSSLKTTTTAIDPVSILKLSLRISIHELSNLASSLSASNSGGSAVADCTEQVDDAVSRLNDSLSAVQASAAAGERGGKGLTEAAIIDVRTWLSAAVTDQQTCLDGLEEMGSPDAAEVKRKMERSGEYTSNSLAIVAHFKTLMEKFHVPLH